MPGARGSATADENTSPQPRGRPDPRAIAPRERDLKILLLEDTPEDAELIERELRRSGLSFEIRRVDTRNAFTQALEAFGPDIVLCDYTLPNFSGSEALSHVRRAHPEIPVVVVTGTLGDGPAIEMLKAGAKDYVLKNNLTRLPASVRQALSVEAGIRARKSAELELRQSEEKFRSLAEAAQDPIVAIDSSGAIVYCNPASTRVFGYSAEEVRGQNVHDWLAPARFREAAAAGFKAFVATGQGPLIGRTREFAALARDGTEIPIELSVGAFRLGGQWQAIAILRDIRERKRAEQALRESEEKFRGLVESSTDWIWEIDAHDAFTYVSPSTKKLLGYEPSEVIGKRYFELMPAGDAERVTAAFEAFKARREAFAALEDVMVRKDGTRAFHETSGVPILGEDGTYKGYRGITRDITERKQTEEKIRESEAQFRAIVEQELAGIYILTLDGKLAYINSRFAAMLGYDPAEAIGRPFLEFIADEDKPATLAEFAARSGGLGSGRISAAIKRKDGGVVQILAHGGSALYQGKPALIGVMLDVTEEKRAAESLQRLNRTLLTLSAANEALVRAKEEDELLQAMCHVIVDRGGYRMAWIGFARNDPAKTVEPVAFAGEGTDYLESIRVTWADEERGRGIGGVAIRTGEPQTSQDIAKDPRMTPWRSAAKQHGYASCATFPLKGQSGTFGVLAIYSCEAGAFSADEVRLLSELADDLAYGIEALRDRAEREAIEQRRRKSLEATVSAIASTVEIRDPYTAGHQKRVGLLAAAIARELHLSEHQIHGIFLAGVIHDVGKITIPAEILTKPGTLTKLEFQLIQAHAQSGYDIIKAVDFPWPIAKTVLQHHERLDGSGYPNGLKGDEIIQEAKILAVADVVDAMMSHRPYRAALGLESALAEITKGKGRLYDEAAVDACIRIMRDQGFRFS